MNLIEISSRLGIDEAELRARSREWVERGDAAGFADYLARMAQPRVADVAVILHDGGSTWDNLARALRHVEEIEDQHVREIIADALAEGLDDALSSSRARFLRSSRS